jgi:pyruvate dehydrogenase E1 component
MIPIYIFYSMFGFQRTGDGFWAAGDQMTRGFVLGATAGRTTLNGEGLQHQDGHSLLLASTNPACVAYDPAWAYEVAVIVEDGLRRMYGDTPGEDIFYYLTVYNEPLTMPAAPADLDTEGLLKGAYRYSTGAGDGPKVQLMASGVGLPWALKAQTLLADEWGVSADVWSVTSWSELRRDAVASEQEALLNPGEPQRTPYITSVLADAPGPVVAVSDWMRAVPDQISRWVPGDYTSLGTDGFGASDTRHALRRRFHVDAESITVAALRELARRGEVGEQVPAEAAKKYQLEDVTAAPVGETGGAS